MAKKKPLIWETVQVPIGDIVPWQFNPRQITEKKFNDLIASLRKWGQVDVVALNKDNTIIGGHARQLAMTQLLDERPEFAMVDCRRASRLLDNDELAEVNIRLNKNIAGEFDFEMLANHFDYDSLIEWGFEAGEFGLDNTEVTDVDASVEPTEPDKAQALWNVELGDIWKIGDNKLICGDCTMLDTVEKLFEGAEADLMVTDPPYGVEYVGKTKDALTIENDALGSDGTYQLVLDFLTIAPLKKGGSYYICSPAGDMETEFRNAIKDSGLMLKQCMVWIKDVMVMGRQDYHWKHESILYGWREGAAHYFIDDRTLVTVWEYDRPKKSKFHPTMKPVDLISNCIQNSSLPGQLVFEPFSGSGTTLLASAATGRVCYAIELDPKYCAVGLQRMADAGFNPERIE